MPIGASYVVVVEFKFKLGTLVWVTPKSSQKQSDNDVFLCRDTEQTYLCQ
jgi:hypothetical protein